VNFPTFYRNNRKNPLRNRQPLQPFVVVVSTQKVYFKMHCDALNNTIKSNGETQRVEPVIFETSGLRFLTIQETMPFTQAQHDSFF
jgi:hypothetical protein